jgi:hypothetical protein
MTAPSSPTTWAITRTLGALALLVVVGVHYQQYHSSLYSPGGQSPFNPTPAA